MSAARKLDRPSWIEVEQDEQVVYVKCQRCGRPVTFYRPYLAAHPDALTEMVDAHRVCRS